MHQIRFGTESFNIYGACLWSVVVIVESLGTSTDAVEQHPVEIKFTNSLSYAERLLLKRNRRQEFGPLADPDDRSPTGHKDETRGMHLNLNKSREGSYSNSSADNRRNPVEGSGIRRYGEGYVSIESVLNKVNASRVQKGLNSSWTLGDCDEEDRLESRLTPTHTGRNSFTNKNQSAHSSVQGKMF